MNCGIAGLPIELHRCRRLPLALCVGVLFAAAHATRAATLPVTSCADDGSAGTLRSVMYSAHNHDIVDLTRLTCSTITLTQGDIDVSWIGYHPLSYLEIDGPGRDQLTIVGVAPARAFALGNSSVGQVVVNDLTITNNGLSYKQPACVLGIAGTLVLNRVTVTGCHSRTPNFPYVGLISGGVAGEVVVLSDSIVSNSSYTAYGYHGGVGGGVRIDSRGVIVNSTISGNRVVAPISFTDSGAPTGGGGIYSDGDLLIVNSTIAGNSVEVTNPGEDGVGGGIFMARSANLTIIGSTISGNTVDGMGGGLYKLGFADLLDNGSTVTIQNSTISGNSAGRAGGGLVSQRPVWLANSTIASNFSGTGGAVMFHYRDTEGYRTRLSLDLESTIIAGNTAGPAATYAADLATDDVLTVTGAHSLVVAPAAGIVLPPDTLHDDPLLLPLDWNGGPVQTLALAPGSPAIDAGSNPLGLPTDARGGGYVRTYGAAPDIGAFEVQPGPDPIFASGFDP